VPDGERRVEAERPAVSALEREEATSVSSEDRGFVRLGSDDSRICGRRWLIRRPRGGE
jgi:hypothetical protein